MATRYYADDSWSDKVKKKFSGSELIGYENGLFELDIHGIYSTVKAEITPTRKNWAISLLTVSLFLSVQTAVLFGIIVYLYKYVNG